MGTHRTTPDGGFTLVEVLVVVTIIVILIVMLMPAMDKAIYQAELVVCAAQQRTVMVGVSAYAIDHKRFYPYKPMVHKSGVYGLPNFLYSPGGVSSTANPSGAREEGLQGAFDNRPYYKDYVKYEELFLDPMAGEVDLTREGSDWDCQVVSAYLHLEGFGFVHDFNKAKVGRGMYKIGDRLAFTDPNNGVYHSWNLLIADTLSQSVVDGAVSSHPDDRGNGSLQNRQNAAPPGYEAIEDTEGSGVVAQKYTYSHYNYFSNTRRGYVDLNFGFQDLSVRQVNNIHPLATLFPRQVEDDRIKPFPYYNEVWAGIHGTPLWVPEGE